MFIRLWEFNHIAMKGFMELEKLSNDRNVGIYSGGGDLKANALFMRDPLMKLFHSKISSEHGWNFAVENGVSPTS